MNIITLIHALRDAIHDSAAIQAFCTTNFGRVHKTYVGVDLEDQPEQDMFPLVVIWPVSKHAGYDLDQMDHVVEVQVGVVKDALATPGKTNAVEFAAFELLEGFRKLVETAVAGATSLEMAELEIEYAPVEVYPLFIAGMRCRLTADYYQGGDVYA